MKGIKTGGRQKGSPNKNTTEIKGLIQSFISANLDDLQSEYEALKPSEKVNFLEKLLRYVLPTQAQVKEVSEFENLSNEQLDKIISELKK